MRRLLLLCLMLSLSGCALLGRQHPPSESEVTQAISEQEFRRARFLIHLLPVEGRGGDLRQRMQQRLHQASERYAEQRIREARRLYQQGQWQAAQELLERAQEQLHQHAELAAALQELQRLQAEALARIEAQRLIQQTRFRLADLERLQQAVRVDSDNARLRRQLSTEESHLETLREALLEAADKAQQRDEPRLARQLLGAAHQIQPGPETRPAPEKTPARAKSRPLPRSSAPPAVNLGNLERLLQRARSQLEQEQLRAARTSLNLALAQAPEHPPALALQQTLQQAIDAEVARLMRDGNRRYRLGEVREARQVWRQVLQLEPEHGAAKAAIQRASTVLDNVERLRRVQQPE